MIAMPFSDAERAMKIARATVDLLNQIASDNGHDVTFSVNDFIWINDGKDDVTLRLGHGLEVTYERRKSHGE